MEMKHIYKEVQKWIYQNARPLDFARWKYFFENGRQEEVINALSAYQNEDGGFGYALEADAWNPNSSPIQTFHAVTTLHEVGDISKDHSMIQGILRYLNSGEDFEDGVWLNTIRSNNEYPHAPWWQLDSESNSRNRYNPTIGLAGFVLCYGDENSELYKKCENIAIEAVNHLLQLDEINMHLLNCYIIFKEYCDQAENIELFSMVQLNNKLISLVQSCITKETEIWATSYICKPSQFIDKPESIFYPGNQEIVAYECEFIKDTRVADSVWNITWGWSDYPEEWAVSKNWWKASIAINNMLFLKNFQN